MAKGGKGGNSGTKAGDSKPVTPAPMPKGMPMMPGMPKDMPHPKGMPREG
jgi:hypothetical protein